jgi:hypothetical protein
MSTDTVESDEEERIRSSKSKSRSKGKIEGNGLLAFEKIVGMEAKKSEVDQSMLQSQQKIQ